MLVVATEALAARTGVPECGVSEQESVDFMQKVQGVMRHYSVETTQKGVDFLALFGSGSMIIGTRFAAYNMRVRMEREERQAQQPSNVIRMPQAPQSAQGAPAQPFYNPGPMDDAPGF